MKKYEKITEKEKNNIEKFHAMQAGDFYMQDGSLVSKDEVTLAAAQKAACIGVVYWLGDVTDDDHLLKRSQPDCTRGLVVALHEAKHPSISPVSLQFWMVREDIRKS